ncbi:hypothetical protein SDC9_34974 [bioreactor metagenome]|uniref:Uncharacterized protein n=1 Tax=bioreactor metagenome TaxID=1076179 RepID=A0A644VC63_9ZZZZ
MTREAGGGLEDPGLHLLSVAGCELFDDHDLKQGVAVVYEQMRDVFGALDEGVLFHFFLFVADDDGPLSFEYIKEDVDGGQVFFEGFARLEADDDDVGDRGAVDLSDVHFVGGVGDGGFVEFCYVDRHTILLRE